MTRAVLVHDVGPGAGLGHRARMLALAPALERRGFTVELAESPSSLADVVVVDSYRFRADDRSLFGTGPVVAVDDLVRDLDVDVVVDPNPGDGSDHPKARVTLVGSQYALLSTTTETPVPVRADVRTVLVTTGATDVAGHGARLAHDLHDAAADLEVRLVVGRWGSNDVPPGVLALRQPPGLLDELMAADVVVTAAGVTLMESLALGRPTVAVILADNQRRAAAAAGAARAAVIAEPEEVVAAVLNLRGDFDGRRALAVAAREYIDGRGPERVAEVVRGLA